MTRLLIVDDEKLTREILVNHIPWSSLGIDEVREASNGCEGLEIALQMQPDVVLSDIRMPKMNGIELAKQLKEKIPDCKVVFLSIYTDKDYLKSAIQLNAVDYVEKPVNLDEVSTAVLHAASVANDLKSKKNSNNGVTKDKIDQRQFFHSKDHIVPYNENNHGTYVIDENSINSILSLIKERNRDMSIISVKRLSNSIRQHDKTDINYVKDCYYRILLQIYKYADEMNIRLNMDDNRRFLWEIISNSDSLNEIEDYLIKLIDSIFRFWESEAARSNISSRITRYIQDNLYDANMSIKTIAEHLYLTPTYLCLIFKKETGKTINQYITEVRMEKARQYLVGTRFKPSEISRKLGYSDVKYFAKSFKKEVGMTPLEYRKKEQI